MTANTPKAVPPAPRPAVNPYLDMPLPYGVRIDFGFWPPLDANDAVRTVVRALNAYAYSTPR